MTQSLSHIRNFSIIAHIDHGKSTLADRLLEHTGTIDKRKMQAQILDSMDLERERGITIKAKAVRMKYRSILTDQEYILNLIDTPGHVDFSYEVSRALAACEGGLLVVDASQGVEAQTMANCYLAKDAGLKIIPVINKIDLPQADPENAKKQIREILEIADVPPLLVSAKEGIGIEDLLESIIEYIPAPNMPKEWDENLFSALVFDSIYDPYKGVIIFLRVFSGELKPKQNLVFLSNEVTLCPEEIGYLAPRPTKSDSIKAGEVGYLVTGLKDIHQINIGDTLTEKTRPVPHALKGYRRSKPFVFAGFYPPNPSEYEQLKAALEKLHLEDSSFEFQAETSIALGFGYRCGFLGLLHMEIIKERLLREFDMDVLVTSPNVIYQIKIRNQEVPVMIDSPAKFPTYDKIENIAEPIVKITIILPSAYMGPVMDMAKDKRGKFIEMKYLAAERIMLVYHMPLSEILLDFHDLLKSITKGYASFDYEPLGYEVSDLVKVDILIHQDIVDALSFVGHEDKVFYQGKAVAEKLRELIPKHQFEIAIQAKARGKIIARETIRAYRKDVIAKCYGGDISRKRKLLERQKEGKRRMKNVGNVEIPNEAFMSVLQISKQQ